MKDLTLEQKIVYRLASKGYITNVGDVSRALREILYAEKIITGNDVPGLKDDIVDEGLGDAAECDHEALTNEEIQEVFDNDNENNEEVNS